MRTYKKPVAHENRDRRFATELDNLEFRRAVESETGEDPGPTSGHVKVIVTDGSPIEWAVEALREIANRLQQEQG